MLLSILIPSIPERLDSLKEKFAYYESMITKYNLTGEVELLSLCDNKKRSIGQKRTDLFALAKGRYVVMTDDDLDRLTRKYFENIRAAIEKGPDVITYYQFARINDDYTFVNFGLGYENQYQNHMGVTLRPAWHCCTWKRDVVKDIKFGDSNYGEDDYFQREANKAARTEYKINDVCHIYEHDSDKTAAFL